MQPKGIAPKGSPALEMQPKGIAPKGSPAFEMQPKGIAPRVAASRCTGRRGTAEDLMYLIVRGGTVVTSTGSRVADVAVDGGRIVAIEPDLRARRRRRPK